MRWMSATMVDVGDEKIEDLGDGSKTIVNESDLDESEIVQQMPSDDVKDAQERDQKGKGKEIVHIEKLSPEAMKENDENDEDGRPRKSARVADAATGDDGETTLRRSRRNAGKKVDYAEIEQDRWARTYRVAHVHIEMEGEPRSANKRTQNPCVSRTFLVKLAEIGSLV